LNRKVSLRDIIIGYLKEQGDYGLSIKQIKERLDSEPEQIFPEGLSTRGVIDRIRKILRDDPDIKSDGNTRNKDFKYAPEQILWKNKKTYNDIFTCLELSLSNDDFWNKLSEYSPITSKDLSLSIEKTKSPVTVQGVSVEVRPAGWAKMFESMMPDPVNLVIETDDGLKAESFPKDPHYLVNKIWDNQFDSTVWNGINWVNYPYPHWLRMKQISTYIPESLDTIMFNEIRYLTKVIAQEVGGFSEDFLLQHELDQLTRDGHFESKSNFLDKGRIISLGVLLLYRTLRTEQKKMLSDVTLSEDIVEEAEYEESI
jgi:hypothetical protein